MKIYLDLYSDSLTTVICISEKDSTNYWAGEMKIMLRTNL